MHCVYAYKLHRIVFINSNCLKFRLGHKIYKMAKKFLYKMVSLIKNYGQNKFATETKEKDNFRRTSVERIIMKYDAV